MLSFLLPGCCTTRASARRRTAGRAAITVPAPFARRGRHTCPGRAWARQARWRRPVGRSRRVKGESFDPDVDGELASGELFDGDHHPTAGRTGRQGHPRGRVGDGWHRPWIRAERVPAAWQGLGATARGQEAVEPDPHEALREYMETEAPEEFLRAEGHEPDLAPVAVVLPPKRHLVLGQGDEPMVGNRDAVGVPCEIVQHVTGAAERRLGVQRPSRGERGCEATRAKAGAWVRCWRSRGIVSVPARNAARRPATNFPRNTRLRTFTGRKNDGRACTHRVPSRERPPAGTTQCTCG